jgi:hypothetical protein
MPLSLRITSILAFAVPAWFNPSNATPPVIEPSPITAIWLRSAFWDNAAAVAMPNMEEMEMEECPPPKASYSLSLIFGKPLIP